MTVPTFWKRCPKCCALFVQKLVNKMKTKASCSSTKPSLFSETIYHSLALKITQQEEAPLAKEATANKNAVQRERLSSQHTIRFFAS